MDIKILKLVYEDLEFLRYEWDQSISDSSITRSSIVLRKLLIDNLLNKAWQETGIQGTPKIKTPTLEYLFKKYDRKEIRFAQAGGAVCNGMEIRTPIWLNRYTKYDNL